MYVTNCTCISKIWDTHTGECLNTLSHNHIVRAIAFPSGPRPHHVATGGFEKKLRIFDLTRSASSSTSSSPTSPDGTNGSNASMAGSTEVGAGVHTGTIKSIVWTSDSNMIITACDDQKIRWWDLRSSSLIATHQLDGKLGTCELNTLSSPSGPSSSILSIAAGKTAYFFDGNTPNQLLKTIKTPYEIASTALHAQQRKIVTGGSGDTWVRVYDYDEEKELNVHKGHHGPVWSVNFSPDGKLYATGSEDGTIKLWKFCNSTYGLWK